MKALKKICVAVAALSVVSIAFLSCRTEDDDYEVISVNSNGASVDFENESKYDVEYARGFVTTNTKHYGGICNMNINSSNQNSSMGFIFGFGDSAAGGYGFGIVGIKSFNGITSSGNGYYVSLYSGVTSDNLSGDSANFGGTEHPLVTTWTESNTRNYQIQVYQVKEAGKLDTNGDGTADETSLSADDYPVGSYVVRVYPNNTEAHDAGASATIKGSDIVIKPTDFKTYTGVNKTGYSQEKLGYYAMVAEGYSLKGNWTLKSTFGAAGTESSSGDIGDYQQW